MMTTATYGANITNHFFSHFSNSVVRIFIFYSFICLFIYLFTRIMLFCSQKLQSILIMSNIIYFVEYNNVLSGEEKKMQ